MEAVELAVAACKADVITKILRCDDWRAWRFWLINNSEYKSEHVRSEVSGPEGNPIPVQFNPFQVQFMLAGDPNVTFSTIDHRGEKAAELADSYIKPKE